jgi:hypothetical protein
MEPVAVFHGFYLLHKGGAARVAGLLSAGRSITEEAVATLDSRPKVDVDLELTVTAVKGVAFSNPIGVCDY